ncbi:m7GpppN-mRNA hydrolase [Microplitis demolitor]|uniref:m7GpppN-mRNA hydrolase n=1 Tax=Microplitis demolitor TaxID=69319 RepID=UPI0004CCE50D|nr:m7GpppN-mRNA hydrolase [Microplitis demolitor]
MAQHTIPLDILDDLSSRFIINVPEDERKDLVRICFQIELAHWFYLDFYCADEMSKLKSCNMKEFSMHIFRHIPFLRSHLPHLDTILEQWREYKQSVPTFGAIVLNEDMSKVLLVQNYWSKNSWGFPKGKVNEDEDPSHCAVREVLEETGFDISGLIDKNDFIESVINDRVVRLYMISGVQKDTKFQPLTRKEIKNVEWFSLNDLPNNTKDMTPKVKMGVGPNAFFMVVPFVRRMKRWVFEKQQREKQLSKRNRHKSLGDVDIVKNKRQQSLQTNTIESKNQRQSNTSPARNRRQAHSKSTIKNNPTDNINSNSSNNSKNLTKQAIKRNLFGDNDTNKSIKKSSSALARQLRDSPREFHYYKQINTIEKQSDSDGNELNSENIESYFAQLKINSDDNSCESDIDYCKFNYKSCAWAQFKFDKQAILNCIANRV